MKAILIQQKVSKALDDPKKYPDALKAKPDEITEMNEIAHSLIILHLSDDVLGQVERHKTAKELWEALDKFLLEKSLPNKIHLLQKLFSFKLDPENDLESNLSDFNRLVKCLAYNEKKFDDEYLAVILLNATPESYRDVRNAITYARDTLTQDIVTDALRARELELKKESRGSSREESLFARWRNETR